VGSILKVESLDWDLPWEPLYLSRGGSGFFLGEHFALARSHSAAQIQALAQGEIIHVRTEQVEVRGDDIKMLPGSPRRISGLDELGARLDQAERIALLHIWGHGGVDPTRPGKAWIQLDGGDLQPAALPLRGQGGLKGAIVLLNVCQAVSPSPLLSSLGGWAEAFIEAGAAAVLGPLYGVHHEQAARFSQGFYAALAQGEAVGEALRQARKILKSEGVFARLAYRLYGDPGLRLERRE